MVDYPVTRPVGRVALDANVVLSRTWSLYKRLFTRSFAMGGVVFGVLQLVNLLVRSSHYHASFAIVSLLLTVAGVALVQGWLVEIVRSLHEDGDDEPSVTEALERAADRVWKLIRVSGRVGLGVALGSVLLLVPGLILMTRWAVSVPVAMLEDGSPRSALRRSRQIVNGNGWAVFKVLFACGAVNLVVTIPLSLAAASTGPFGRWIALTLASALTAPYVAHALTVIYYTLTAPERPVILEPGRRWDSVWRTPVEAEEQAPADESIWDEYQRKFDEREKQWGGG